MMPEPTATYVRNNKKIGANDPCPCGSGEKFKRCCRGKGFFD
ncbi:MAG: SEC-C domain-containing protein [Lachnospiraceae bacterium]|nr:SEC-C domain-containing protein [Lachnospiraceae bacterium]